MVSMFLTVIQSFTIRLLIIFILLLLSIKANGKNCVCVYSDGDEEDLSMADLRRLKELAKLELKCSSSAREMEKTIHPSADLETPVVVATFLANVAQPKQKQPSTSNTSGDTTVGIGTADDIDTGKVQIWSCVNAENRGNTCLQSVCDTCYSKKEEAPSTRGMRGTEQPKKVAKVVGGKSCNLDHDKQITFEEADLQYIVGPWADRKRKLKVDYHLPVCCAKCGGKFV